MRRAAAILAKAHIRDADRSKNTLDAWYQKVV